MTINPKKKMGKYSKGSGGVRTRAKTLALQKASSYIELRSRRLVKPTPPKTRSNKLSGVKKLVPQKEDDAQPSIGENLLEIRRSTRETTPCSLIRDPDNISTPSSSTKRSYSNNANNGVQSSAPSHIPVTVEMDAFFTEPERQQQQLFIEKYNFDPVNDKPLPGRFEWVKMDGTKDFNQQS